MLQRIARLATGLGRDRQGAAAVEFALALPILVTMAVGLTDMGLAVTEKMRITSAVRAGVQAGYGDPSATGAIVQAVHDASETVSTLSVTTALTCGCADGSTVACDGNCASGSVRTYLSVTASEPYALLVSYPGLSGPATLSATAAQRVK